MIKKGFSTLKDSIWDDAVAYPAENLTWIEEEEETTTIRLFIWEEDQ
jgi:hypothetical protein